jgi:hypothetical protein
VGALDLESIKNAAKVATGSGNVQAQQKLKQIVEALDVEARQVRKKASASGISLADLSTVAASPDSAEGRAVAARMGAAGFANPRASADAVMKRNEIDVSGGIGKKRKELHPELRAMLPGVSSRAAGAAGRATASVGRSAAAKAASAAGAVREAGGMAATAAARKAADYKERRRDRAVGKMMGTATSEAEGYEAEMLRKAEKDEAAALRKASKRGEV